MRAFVGTLVALCVMVAGAPSDMEESRKVVERHLAPPEASQASPSPRDPTLCQRRPLNVSFADLGWEWIIAPPTYDAGYCAGACHSNQLQTPYSLIVRQNAEANPHDVPKPCCVPKEFEPINMAYYDHDKNVVVGNIIDMKVRSCGCR